jgi:hypothetical protein
VDPQPGCLHVPVRKVRHERQRLRSNGVSAYMLTFNDVGHTIEVDDHDQTARHTAAATIRLTHASRSPEPPTMSRGSVHPADECFAT